MSGGGGSGAGGRLLLQDAPEPEREPVKFDIHIRGAPPEIFQLVQSIKDVAEQILFHWKTFPIVLPPPVSSSTSVLHGGGGGDASLPGRSNGTGVNGNGFAGMGPSSGGSGRPLNMRDLFLAPSFDELDAVAADPKGEPRRLTDKQLEIIRERGLHKDKYGKPKKLSAAQLENIRRLGEFEVDSVNFPGQVHRWRLSQLLQKGSERRRDALLGDMALALRFIIVTARARIVAPHFFSVRQALKSLLAGTLRLIDIVIGTPSLQAHNLDARIREERCRYLVAELVCKQEYEEDMERFCQYVQQQIRRASMEKFRLGSETPPTVPYLFLTPKGVELDLRLFNRDLIRRALPILVGILERETRGWFLHFRERLISEFRNQKMPNEEIEREVNLAVMHEYLQRVYNSILANPDIASLGEGIGQLLVQQAQSVVLMHRAVENVQRKLSKTQESLKSRIKYMYPVLSRIQPWMRDKLRSAEMHFIEECQWGAHEEALLLCKKQQLSQTMYFLSRDLTFMREREPVLTKELRKVKTPTRSFQWRTQIWLPSNWIVRRCFQGQSEVIPTVLSETATSITTPRSDPSQPVFLIEKEVVRTTTTRWPLWRWINYCHRTWSWTWNAMFFFGVVIPWCSPVSLRALFQAEPFMPDLELSQVNGTLFPRKSSLTPTLCSRLLSLWRHISKSRTHFETKPDTGFIGKGLTRHVNRIWNYMLKGLIGTLTIMVVFPILCLVTSIGSLVIALVAFLWMPLVTFGLHLFMALAYDFDCPDPEHRNRYLVVLEAIIWDFGVQGILQPIAASFIAFIACPLLSFVILIVGIVRFTLRMVWDFLMFHMVIKKRGRVPASDSFVVKRIAGPGLASNYFYQIKPEQALAAFEAKMELDELAAFQHEMEQIILRPQKEFSHFVDACFKPFSASLSKEGPYRILEKEAQDLTSSLHEKLEKRRRDLQTGLGVGVRSRIKLSARDLKIAIQQAALILERFHPTHIMKRLPVDEEEFWENKGLSPNDWAGLAGLMYSEIFSLDFLTPLDDADTKFRLEPHQVDLSRYTELVREAELDGAPDLLGPVYAPRGNIQVHSPYLEVAAFNPRSRLSATGHKIEKRGHSWQPWKRKSLPYSGEKLLIPLPVPHPAHITVSIHNRDGEEPIPLDSELCQSILKAVEDYHHHQHHSNSHLSGGPHQSQDSSSNSRNEADRVARYRGGGNGSIHNNRNTDEDQDDRERDMGVQAVSVVDDTTADAVRSIDSVSQGSGISLGRPDSWRRQPDWGAGSSRQRRRNSGSVRVDLASPEDVSLDSDGIRVSFGTYGTTV
ncbi:uncharacterized protein LOC124162073 isoform X1 [Ischnura elegans]|uniref:uncharacterized protein LOC124162073 isoform X1 n=1 Tax=Ischnura elegans TaxID=197161 RepID=UPI001ED89B37|nr:uncharacterized protein LOC124162073 isoform X1 [Ischnura elegans]XP_046394399.1 uncharacterized protein LOC124162073 isoform X1 [Ischnura elegans]XP_046394408.1 uncharacterized protein LOC124162073 isoform X1 [Ischnura elegans]XP_046394417.1 uncharacterized protein LOC124162073 isoform X1 [Ischnura elegans]XP_046394426.1 uncharacterized protein LOC124162073 isoform X1 [Ischnura elegans]